MDEGHMTSGQADARQVLLGSRPGWLGAADAFLAGQQALCGSAHHSRSRRIATIWGKVRHGIPNDEEPLAGRKYW